MSKRITTHWYIAAWMVWLVAFIGLAVSMHSAQVSGSSSPQPVAILEYAVMAIAVVVALVMWIGALIRLGQHHAWGWFAVVLTLHLIALGIIGMVAYALAGPEDVRDVAIRPRSVA